MKREMKFPWWGWLGILCLLPVVYVLSSIPVAWVLQKLELFPQKWFITLYSPLFWAMAEWNWFLRIMEWIIEQTGLW